jgi:hypothetical protein
VTGEQLNVAQRAAGLVNKPGGSGDERAAARMGGAAGETDSATGEGEPVDVADGRHRLATLGSDDRPGATCQQAPSGEGGLQRRVDRNAAAAVLLGDAVVELDGLADLAGRIEHHVPGQIGNLAGPQPGFGRQQHDQLVTDGVAGSGGKEKEVGYLLIMKYLGPCLMYTMQFIESRVSLQVQATNSVLIKFCIFLHKSGASRVGRWLILSSLESCRSRIRSSKRHFAISRFESWHPSQRLI